ncbi:SsgA family sporulation/cell division regulator [Kitasatospora sp. NPDC096147]|uniref:SsgA family sporulation/cell division regulator n=1 Tax=Kitasatospora sp. NPDC096147 TaxID=3364093 RepID=UPI00382FCBF9
MSGTHSRPPHPAFDGDESCSALLTMNVVGISGINVQVPALLTYRARDPYAVELECHTDTNHPTRWTFGRDLLTRGCTGQAGLADVRVEPGHLDGADIITITLTGFGGRALLRTPAAPVRAFLDASERLVPRGTESSHLHIDDLVRRLLQPSAPERDLTGQGLGADSQTITFHRYLETDATSPE